MDNDTIAALERAATAREGLAEEMGCDHERAYADAALIRALIER